MNDEGSQDRARLCCCLRPINADRARGHYWTSTHDDLLENAFVLIGSIVMASKVEDPKHHHPKGPAQYRDVSNQLYSPIDDTHLFAVMGTSTSGEQKEAKKHVKIDV